MSMRELETARELAPRSVRDLADEAFTRAAGAPLVSGNCVRLLKDATENYPVWLDAIRQAEKFVFFESYTFYDDRIGNEFADALIAKAREGVRVRLIYDWFGKVGNDLFSGKFWKRISEGSKRIRCSPRAIRHEAHLINLCAFLRVHCG